MPVFGTFSNASVSATISRRLSTCHIPAVLPRSFNACLRSFSCDATLPATFLRHLLQVAETAVSSRESSCEPSEPLDVRSYQLVTETLSILATRLPAVPTPSAWWEFFPRFLTQAIGRAVAGAGVTWREFGAIRAYFEPGASPRGREWMGVGADPGVFGRGGMGVSRGGISLSSVPRGR